MYREDTIVAVATPPGRSALGVVRISGPGSKTLIEHIFVKHVKNGRKPGKIKPRFAHYGSIHDPAKDSVIDEVVMTWFPGPDSYSGEDLVEISCHGNPFILDLVLHLVLELGARLAQPGEFTFRAFMNGRLDLAQAEAVSDLINARNRSALMQSLSQLEGSLSSEIVVITSLLRSVYARFVLAIDFPEEDVPELETETMLRKLERIRDDLETLIESMPTSLLIKEGYLVPIVGLPNVGKSSLLNHFLRTDRAIVNEQPGTTRDSIEENILLEGHMVNLVDTAGIRVTGDPVESEGVRRTYETIRRSFALIVLLEPHAELSQAEEAFLEETQAIPRVLAYNKIDLVDPRSLPDCVDREPVLKISIKEKTGLDLVNKALLQVLTTPKNESPSPQEDEFPRLTNIRQQKACQGALAGVERAITSIGEQLQHELIAFEIEQAMFFLDELVGKTTPDDILHDIFSQFCIGK